MTARKTFYIAALLLFTAVAAANSFAQVYRIGSVRYDIKGSTREYPLSMAVPVDSGRLFASEAQLKTYLDDLAVRLNNQRVLESATVESAYDEADENGIIPVSLVIHTVDTWNIIALPYPKYDSNSGFELKLKFKDYNFFGSMQVLTGDVNYKVDNDGKTAITSNLDFSIPFRAWNYDANWKAEASVELPQDQVPLWKFTTGFNIAFPVGWTSIVCGLDQSIVINDRNSEDEYYRGDGYYLRNELYANVPFPLYHFERIGDLTLTPSVSVDFNWAFDGIQNEDLLGPTVSWGYGLGLGRIDWVGNYRYGFKASTGTSWSYNLDHGEDVSTSISGSASGYTALFNRLGVTGRARAFYNFNGSTSNSAGEEMRGILNDRLQTDTALTLNLDLPLSVLRVNFKEMTGVSWTEYIGFELQVSPFFDMTLSHDTVSGRNFSFSDGWYSGGLELIVYPAKMRSIYGRISVGYDLEHVITTGSLSGYAERDGEAVREMFFGIGLHY